MLYGSLGVIFSCSKIFMVITFLSPPELWFTFLVCGLNYLQHVLSLGYPGRMSIQTCIIVRLPSCHESGKC